MPHKKEWEEFVLENRGNGGFAIKSLQNTYLTNENGNLEWKSQPLGGRDVWSFQVLGSGNQQGFNQQIGQGLGQMFNQGPNNQGHNNQGFQGNNQGFQGGFQGKHH